MTLPKIAVLLPTYRQPEILVLTLRDLNEQRYPVDSWELIIVDDGGKDGALETALRILDQDISVTVKRFPEGGTYSHGRIFNELIRLANPRSEVFIHLEDVRVRPNVLLEHAKWHRTDINFLVTGPMCEGPVETFDESTCFRWKTMTKSGVRSQAYRCCFQAVFAKSMSYSRSLLVRLRSVRDPDPFDGLMSGWGYHETEFAYRADLVGAICVYDSSCGVYHPPHNERDESQYRGTNRSTAKKVGTSRNVEYLCAKHGLPGLPEWKNGEPIQMPTALTSP